MPETDDDMPEDWAGIANGDYQLRVMGGVRRVNVARPVVLTIEFPGGVSEITRPDLRAQAAEMIRHEYPISNYVPASDEIPGLWWSRAVGLIRGGTNGGFADAVRLTPDPGLDAIEDILLAAGFVEPGVSLVERIRALARDHRDRGRKIESLERECRTLDNERAWAEGPGSADG